MDAGQGFCKCNARSLKVQLAAEVHEQKLQEAQEIAEAFLDAETKLGELTAKMEKASNQYSARDNGVHSTKTEQLEEIGITEKQKQRFETLARHPEVVEKAKEDARADVLIKESQSMNNLGISQETINEMLSDRLQRKDKQCNELRARDLQEIIDVLEGIVDQLREKQSEIRCKN